MSVASVEELRLAFDQPDLDRILGTLECAWVDFKSQPYRLDTDKGTWELCKDVAGFANAGGGCIVIGIATTKDPHVATERAHELRPVPVAMANRDQHRDKIVAGVFPMIDGLNVATYGAPDGACYLVIHVPIQSTDVRPFLVRYFVDVDGRRVNGFGWPVRVDDAVTWHGCEHFQNRLSLGGLLQAAVTQSRATQQRDPSSEMLRRHGRLLEAMEIQEPVLIYQFTPLTRIDLTSQLYGSDGVAAAVRERPPLRPRGFNVVAHSAADVRADNGIEWGSRWRTAIDSDGVFMAAAPVTDEALGRTATTRRSGPVVSPVFLVEWTNDVLRVFHEIVRPRAGLTHEHWRLSVIAIGMCRGNVSLPRLDPRFIDDDELHRASADDFRHDVELVGDADRDTFRALTVFYALFGLGPDAIPFTRNDAFSAQPFLEAVRR
jgi:hypothetical protein